MKRILLIITGIWVPFILTGAARLGDVVYKDMCGTNIHNVGDTLVSNSKFKKAIVTGPFKAEKSYFDYISAIGPVLLNEVKASSVQVTGATEIQDSRFSKVEVSGSFRCLRSTARDLHVTGACLIQESTIVTAALTGNPIIEKSSIERISAHAQEICIKDAKVKSLILEKQKKQPQVVRLSGHAEVESIDFQVQEGRVIVEGNNVRLGRVNGGKIERVESSEKTSSSHRDLDVSSQN